MGDITFRNSYMASTDNQNNQWNRTVAYIVCSLYINHVLLYTVCFMKVDKSYISQYSLGGGWAQAH